MSYPGTSTTYGQRENPGVSSGVSAHPGFQRWFAFNGFFVPRAHHVDPRNPVRLKKYSGSISRRQLSDARAKNERTASSWMRFRLGEGREGVEREVGTFATFWDLVR